GGADRRADPPRRALLRSRHFAGLRCRHDPVCPRRRHPQGAVALREGGGERPHQVVGRVGHSVCPPSPRNIHSVRLPRGGEGLGGATRSRWATLTPTLPLKGESELRVTLGRSKTKTPVAIAGDPACSCLPAWSGPIRSRSG